MDDDVGQVAPLYRSLISDDILSEFDQQLLVIFLRSLLPFSDSFVVANNNQVVGFVFALPDDTVKFRKFVYVLKNFREFLALNLFSQTLLFKLLKKLAHIFSQTKQIRYYFKKSLRLLAIGIREDYQGRGLGTDLLKKLETKPRDCGILVSTFKTNVGGMRFYQKAGFSLMGFDNHKNHFFKPAHR